MDADGDTELAEALLISAAEAAARSDPTKCSLDETFQVSRGSISPKAVVDGSIVQINTVDQFNQLWESIIAENHGPKAICGYLAAAYAIELVQKLSCESFGESIGRDKFDELVTELRDPKWNEEVLLPRVQQNLSSVYQSRSKWISEHSEHFQTKRDERECVHRPQLRFNTRGLLANIVANHALQV